MNAPTDGASQAAPSLALPLAAMALAAVIWGVSFPATKAAMAEVPPVAFATMRFLLSSAILALVLGLKRQVPRVPRALWGRVMLVGLTGTTLTYVFENAGLAHTSSANGALIIALTPLVTVVGAVAFLGEPLSWKLGLGTLLAAGGVTAMVGANVAVTGAGDALMFGALVVNVITNLASKRLADELPVLVSLAATFAFGTLVLFPCAGAEALWGHFYWHPTGVTAIALLYLALGSTCLAYALWMYALGFLGAARTSLFLYLCPPVTLVGGHFLLQEHLGWDSVLETGVILFGVFLATTARRV